MNINASFPSKYIKSSDLQGRRVTVTMNYVKVEKVGDDERPVLYFLGKEKGMVLNKTNANTISMAYTSDTDNWAGQQIDIYEADVEFAGKMTKGLRVALPVRQRQNVAAPAPAPEHRSAPPSHIIQAPQRAPAVQIDDDQIPF